LDDDDLDFVMTRRDGPARLAAGLQIGAFRLMGFIPEELAVAPSEMVLFVADQVHAVVEDRSRRTR
jgi:hypothetical protein